MKRALCAGLFLAFICVSAVRAEILPTFGVGLAYSATHIVVVKTVAAKEGKDRLRLWPHDCEEVRFQVVESWKGDLKKGSILKLPALAKVVKGEMVVLFRLSVPFTGRSYVLAKEAKEMVLFLRGQGQPAGHDWRTSVVWLDGDKVTAVQQPMNPGPAYVTTIPDIPSRKALKEDVLFRLESQHAFEVAKAIQDLDKRVKALDAIINGHSTRQEQAIVELGKCGPKAVPVLEKFLELPADHSQQYAVAALVEAGGEKVVPALNKMLEAELDYWKKTGPKLERGWMFRSDTEPSKRFTKLEALVGVYRKYPVPALRKNIVAARAFFRTIPAIDAEPGFGSISKYCDNVLKSTSE